MITKTGNIFFILLFTANAIISNVTDETHSEKILIEFLLIRSGDRSLNFLMHKIFHSCCRIVKLYGFDL